MIDTSKPKKCQKLDRPKCLNSCKRESKHNSGLTKEDIEECFGHSINNENQELVTDSFPFRQEHMWNCIILKINAPYVSLVWNKKVIATVQNLTCLISTRQRFSW